jgi:hypothetical protein
MSLIKGSFTYCCEHCGQEGELKLTGEPRKQRVKSEKQKPRRIRALEKGEPITSEVEPGPVLSVRLEHLGFWLTDDEGIHHPGQDPSCSSKSVIISPSSLFYVYKLALRHYLLSQQMTSTTKT